MAERDQSGLQRPLQGQGRKLARRWYTTAEELRDYFSRSEAEALEGGA